MRAFRRPSYDVVVKFAWPLEGEKRVAFIRAKRAAAVRKHADIDRLSSLQLLEKLEVLSDLGQIHLFTPWLRILAPEGSDVLAGQSLASLMA